MPATTLTGTRVTLRAARESDVADRLANGKHPDIVRAYGGDPEIIVPLTAEQAQAWVARMADKPLDWVIEHEGRCVGSAGLHSVNEHDARATYAVGLQVHTLLGRGLGTEATRLVLAHAFGELQLHRVGLRVLASNKRAIRCYEACGFRMEGRERESARLPGGWEDDLMMGCLASEFIA